MVNAATAIGIPAAVLAHQGGWDEILLIAGPIIVVVGLLALARRRVTRAQPAATDPTSGRDPSRIPGRIPPRDDSRPDGGDPASRPV
jgi:hypothetical protein